MLAGECYLPRKRLERAVAVQDVLIGHFDVLDTMAPQDFLLFRTVLGHGSGGQSAQFWEIALLSGARDATQVDRPWHTPQERARLRRRYTEPTLWDGFLCVLAGAGLPVDTAADRFASYHRIAEDRDRHRDLWDLLDAMVAHDQAWARWQARHLLCVQRQIGRRHGTAGSPGAAHLQTHRDIRFYPELWELRSML
jgi:tryptophan 2,3-dioxygenase